MKEKEEKHQKTNFNPISDVLKARQEKLTGSRVYAHHEFQDFGVWLSEQLHDPKHRALYIKLAKEKPRIRLHEAMVFAVGYNTKSVNRGKLFMWKLKEMEKEADLSSKVP
jgi:hypothetical protein